MTSEITLGPAHVTANFEDGTQIVLSAVSMALAMEEECLEHFSGPSRVPDRHVVIGRTVTATFDVTTFEIAEMPEDPTPEVKQKLDMIRVIRF